ncbi:MAG: division/cell wall cluster transcriptional repressor MraZ [Candidatus Pacebacteria bacterium CG_4_10_14_0_8_um_filter_43_12]|nr:MAG: division/cell wall cluster transcriptional repressor MraZ [Candidatus Pacebacteria bacterium CG_4_10_14_0_8_um_filter_43_12]
MLLGKYYHTLEANGRLSLPKSFRGVYPSWIVTRGLDGGLFLIGEEVFKQELDQLSERSLTKKRNRDFIRLMTNEAKPVTPDTAGRVQLPEYLIQFAGLKKEVVIVGSLNKIEIWDRDRYHTYLDTVEPEAEKIAESLDESAN